MSSPIQAGDAVEIRGDWRKIEYARVYGAAAQKSFVVEALDRSHGRYAVVGGGMLVWRSFLRRLRTKRQRERDALKKAEATK